VNQKEADLTPISHGICPTCDALWRKYGIATAEHIKLLMESQKSALARDTANDETLMVAIAKAGQRRESARAEIQEHELVAHEATSG
jgi:hypothetical protein